MPGLALTRLGIPINSSTHFLNPEGGLVTMRLFSHLKPIQMKREDQPLIIIIEKISSTRLRKCGT